jgi:hypothetical protein
MGESDSSDIRDLHLKIERYHERALSHFNERFVTMVISHKEDHANIVEMVKSAFPEGDLTTHNFEHRVLKEKANNRGSLRRTILGSLGGAIAILSFTSIGKILVDALFAMLQTGAAK